MWLKFPWFRLISAGNISGIKGNTTILWWCTHVSILIYKISEFKYKKNDQGLGVFSLPYLLT